MRWRIDRLKRSGPRVTLVAGLVVVALAVLALAAYRWSLALGLLMIAALVAGLVSWSLRRQFWLGFAGVLFLVPLAVLLGPPTYAFFARSPAATSESPHAAPAELMAALEELTSEMRALREELRDAGARPARTNPPPSADPSRDELLEEIRRLVTAVESRYGPPLAER